MDKLNLTPQERRLVAGVGLIVFVFLNIWLVWPHFGDWRKIQNDRDKAERTVARYQKEVGRLKGYQAKVNELEEMGQSVVPEEQDVNLATVVQVQSQVHKLELTGNSDARSSITQTNQFFDEQARRITYRAGTEELVNFLTSLTSNNSLIRVRDMSIYPDPPNAPTRLRGDITLVASYQRKAPAKPAAVASTTVAAPQSKPATVTSNVQTASRPASAPSTASTPGSSISPRTNQALSATSTNRSTIPKPKPNLPKS